MSHVATQAGMTAEEFAILPDGIGYELVEGELKDRNVSSMSSWVGVRISKILANYVDDQNLGCVFGSDNGYQCFPEQRRTVRKPDVSFVRADRLVMDALDRGWLRVVPDLVVEVVSPNDFFSDVDQKVQEYLKVGVPLIWVATPPTRTVWVFRGDGTAEFLHPGDTLSGEVVLPGFSCQVSDLFWPVIPQPTENILA